MRRKDYFLAAVAILMRGKRGPPEVSGDWNQVHLASVIDDGDHFDDVRNVRGLRGGMLGRRGFSFDLRQNRHSLRLNTHAKTSAISDVAATFTVTRCSTDFSMTWPKKQCCGAATEIGIITSRSSTEKSGNPCLETRTTCAIPVT
jgi:hypothetical protein